jgi:hypothetical protein
VMIQASDAIVGTIDTSGARWYGGDVTVKTDVPFKSGAIATDGAQKGIIEIGALDASVDRTDAIELQDLPSLASSKDADTVRQNVLILLIARRLAGQKMTAQEIADKLGLSIEEAEIAVLSPIGDEIKVDTPDLSRLSQSGRETSSLVIPLGVPFIIIGGGVILYIYINHGDTIVTATDKSGREIWRRTGDAAQDLAHKYFPGIFRSSQDHGGGKNAQHGKSVVPPSLLKELEEAIAKLAKLKAEQGSRKEKIELAQKIDKLQKKIAQILKGQNHNQKAKGSNGQSKR